VVLDLSRLIARHPRPESLSLVCDLLPGSERADLELDLRERAQAAGRSAAAALAPESLPRRVAQALTAQAGIDVAARAAELTREQRRRFVDCLKSLVLPVAGTLGFAKAEVTAGGVDLREVDSRTLESRKLPGLYFAGEILDLDGPIGGYNFQAAFSTGWLAGESV
jgi:predicted Rossmann fold flavoprotein